jgi:hypothetical protein
VRFKVVGGPLQFSLNASSSGNRTELRNMTTFERIPGTSGTLDPGSYEVSDAALCASAGDATEGHNFSMIFTLTP